MSTVTFENGKSVNFEGTPSSADIEEVAGKLGIQSNTPPTNPVQDQRTTLQAQGQPVSVNPNKAKPSFVGGILRDIATPFARLGTNVVQTAEVATGNKTTEPFSGNYLGKVTPVGQQANFGEAVKDSLGTGLQVASNLPIGAGIGSIAENGIKGAIKEAAIQGTKQGAISGGLQGTGQALNQNKSVLDSLVQGGVGAGIGGVTGGVLGGITGGIGAVKNLISPSEGAVNRAKSSIIEQYKKVLPLTPTQQSKEATLLENKGDNVYTTLVKNGINLGSPEAPKHLQDISDQFENATSHAQANEHSFFNIDDIKSNASKQIDQRIPSAKDRVTAKKSINDEISALIKENPQSITKGQNGETRINSDLVERLRRIGNGMTPFNASDPQKIGQSTGYALSNAVRDQVDKEGTFPAYREANNEWGKIIHAQEVLANIDNKGKPFKIPGGLSGAVSRKVLSGALGFHTAGLGGAILGEMGSEYGAKIMSNPELRTYIERQVINNSNGGKKITPEVITRLKQQVDEYLAKQNNLPQLPGPSSIPLNASERKVTPSNTIANDIQQNNRILQNTKQLPAPRMSEIGIPLGAKRPNPSSVEVISAQKNPVSVNPKTGKFQTSYSSGGVKPPKRK